MDIDPVPNGHSAGDGERPSPFTSLKLAVDSYTLDAASGKQRLKQIEEDGSLTFEEPKAPATKRTEDLQRIWTEYPSGLLDLREADLRSADPNTTYGAPEAATEEEAGGRGEGSLMSPEEMESLRSEVVADLNAARNELWWILELAKTLSSSSGITSEPPPEPIAQVKKKAPPAKTAPPPPTLKDDAGPAPILPPGTYSTTPAAAPERPAFEKAHELELALSAKAAALGDCAALIDAAVDELRLMNEAGGRWSSDIRSLRTGEMEGEGKKGGPWAVVPKPDFGRTGEQAKDVVVPYALDEAPSGLHARSMAAFDLDPRKNALEFGARTYMRLRVLHRTGGADGQEVSSRTYDTASEGEDALKSLEAAQMETVDEDLYNELSKEAIRLDTALVEPQNISVTFGDDRLCFQMYDSRNPPTEEPASARCDALLSAARLGLLHKYQRRKVKLIDTPYIPSQPLLAPLVHVLQFQSACRTIGPALERIAAALIRAGRPAKCVARYAACDPGAVVGLIASRAKVDVLGAVYTLEIDECPGLSVSITAPAAMSVTTPRATFPLREGSDVLSREIAAQLSARAFSVVHEAGDASVFFDELDDVVVAGALGPISISLPEPYDRVRASVEDGVPEFEGDNLEAWLAEVGRAAAEHGQAQ